MPLILTDPYGHFKPGPERLPAARCCQATAAGRGQPGRRRSPPPARVQRPDHAFLNDIAHSAVPTAGLALTPTRRRHQPAPAARGHLRQRAARRALRHRRRPRQREHRADRRAHRLPRRAQPAGRATSSGAQRRSARPRRRAADAARRPRPGTRWTRPRAGATASGSSRRRGSCTEMQYQHLVFEEFARKVVPLDQPVPRDGINFVERINPAISRRVRAHRSTASATRCCPRRSPASEPNGTTNDIPLFDAFLNPLEFNNGGPGGTADRRAGRRRHLPGRLAPGRPTRSTSS